jgi:methylenetetrahydrofolate reductase (NADPH)
MPKITEILAATKAAGTSAVSFEFFPAKNEEGIYNLLHRIEKMSMELKPAYIALTWKATFKDEQLSMTIATTIQQQFGVDVLLHLTCHLPKSDLQRIVRKARESGIKNILALRGDPPAGQSKWKTVRGGFSNAVELVRMIREEHGDFFCVGVAGYPEVHLENWNSPDLPPSTQATRRDLERLKEKQDCGADFVITQFCYDCKVERDWLKRARAAGVAIPVIAGHMPIQNYTSFQKFTSWCKSTVPGQLRTNLKQIQNDDDAVREYGIKFTIEHCKALLKGADGEEGRGRAQRCCVSTVVGHPSLTVVTIPPPPRPTLRHPPPATRHPPPATRHPPPATPTPTPCPPPLFPAGFHALHFITMNLEHCVTAIVQGLELPRHVQNQRKLPFQQGHCGGAVKGGADDEIRPIFWSNRAGSYASRTSSWDDYPNGRWGNRQSPAYGELTDYYLSSKRTKVDSVKWWGVPQRVQDVSDVFVGYLDRRVPELPWCEATGISEETADINEDLRWVNNFGFWTINSQPPVNCVPSADPRYGWGATDG